MDEYFSYRNLRVYQQAKKLVHYVYDLLRLFPKEEQYALCDQLRRAVVSIPSNIAEGEGRTLYGTKVQIDGIYRREVAMLPEVIFRESILNAMVHRDYSSHSSFLNVCVNSSSLKIISYGGLLDGITIPLLLQEHNSILRNPDIANVCYLYNLIEVAGSGTLRILSESRLYPGLEPQWQDSDNIVTLTLNGIVYSPIRGLSRHRIQVSNASMQQVLDVILSYIEKNPGCKLQQIQEVVGKSLASTKRYIQFLKDNGVIQYVGSLKSGGYKLLD